MTIKIEYSDGSNRTSEFQDDFDPLDLLFMHEDIVRIAKVDDEGNETEIFSLIIDPI